MLRLETGNSSRPHFEKTLALRDFKRELCFIDLGSAINLKFHKTRSFMLNCTHSLDPSFERKGPGTRLLYFRLWIKR